MPQPRTVRPPSVDSLTLSVLLVNTWRRRETHQEESDAETDVDICRGRDGCDSDCSLQGESSGDQSSLSLKVQLSVEQSFTLQLPQLSVASIHVNIYLISDTLSHGILCYIQQLGLFLFSQDILLFCLNTVLCALNCETFPSFAMS